jgi:hypothetical protein
VRIPASAIIEFRLLDSIAEATPVADVDSVWFGRTEERPMGRASQYLAISTVRDGYVRQDGQTVELEPVTQLEMRGALKLRTLILSPGGVEAGLASRSARFRIDGVDQASSLLEWVVDRVVRGPQVAAFTFIFAVIIAFVRLRDGAN